ncbi:MAG: fumarylacetoacetate hydrolase family protein [Myxococcota bacterium]|nr:fumarylacetoacetate hydrolase family protein [Myxococcota bacterium]
MTRLANREGRALLLAPDGRSGADLERASGGRFGHDPMQAIARLSEISAWCASESPQLDAIVAAGTLGPCVPDPRQVFAIGLNYRDHAAEAGLDIPKVPMVFTKFPSCLAGPESGIPISSETVDWEAELVVVIERETRDVAPEDALACVAGVCIGQDVSDRRLQFNAKPPQFSLGKSCRGFGPIGPAVVTLDEAGNPDDLAILCDVDGQRMQESRTSDMIFSVPDLVSFLSRHCTLLPGDLIFTGTPAGVGSVREPRRFLKAGETLITAIEGLGELRNPCVSAE